ncbi:MAG: hydantoinase/oxoprolinase family protein [Planctomycetota bacterium]
MATRIGIDTGGTFTDVAVVERDGIAVYKLPSTPADPAQAVLDGLAAVRGPAAVDVVHGTTVGLNAVLTGHVAKTAFVTNGGFEDLIEIGRQSRTDLYDLAAQKPQLPVPRQWRFGIASRRAADGTRLERPSRAALLELRRKLAQAKVEAVAVGLLHAHSHSQDERDIAQALASLRLPVTCSAALLASAGEYERYASAILNAAITPIMGSYLSRLEAGVRPGRLRLMRSSGGIMPAGEASEFPIRAAFSGPAGGVLATRQHAAALSLGTVAAFDMGGTSTDVCLVTPEPTVTDGARLAGLPVAVPAVDVHTIGCGGGSIASVDAGGALRVGPQSAGADPGPACYGRAELPTVTDAHMALGHMGPETLLGGGFPVDPDRSVRAIETLGRRLGCKAHAAAMGVLEVAEVAMMRALLVITAERAIDPATVPLVAYGGAGGLHAASLARRLAMPRALVPPHPGAFSAVGLALAGDSHEASTPLGRPLDRWTASELRALGKALGAAAREQLVAAEPGRRAVRVRVDARLRFFGQGQPLDVPLGTDLAGRFRTQHQQLFGFVPNDTVVELVELRARAERAEFPLPKPPRPSRRRRTAAPAFERRPPIRGAAPWPVYRRSDLDPGGALRGPALIEEPTGVTVLPAMSRAEVSAAGLLISPAER